MNLCKTYFKKWVLESKSDSQACKPKFRLRELTSSLCPAAALDIYFYFKCHMAGLEAIETGNELFNLNLSLQACRFRPDQEPTKLPGFKFAFSLRDLEGRYAVAAETRNNLVAASQNISGAQRYLANVQFPYCAPPEVETLNKVCCIYLCRRTLGCVISPAGRLWQRGCIHATF